MIAHLINSVDSEISIPKLCRAIVTQVLPNPSQLAKHGGNWPADATCAIEYKIHDKSNPTVNHLRQAKFFNDERDMRKWLDEQRDWVKSTDHDFTICYSIYEWNHGPEFQDNGWL